MAPVMHLYIAPRPETECISRWKRQVRFWCSHAVTPACLIPMHVSLSLGNCHSLTPCSLPPNTPNVHND
ncbi:conserved hypothetical protein [Ricinus communis]|uniref:Uncharacterized protein n=1 Tax=Ricinus communis TaxID=3988 RepID=B9SHE1_RICCO|nr:conserved hypothetical protein [Ricinus communis]